MKKGVLFILLVFFGIQNSYAEYRAYLIEAYDHILKKKWEVYTGFSPDKYIQTHGGKIRLSALVKATWMCHGDTSAYTPACPMPKPIKPRFQKGESVRVTLEKHITKGWIGMVEHIYYQASARSNVVGIKFGQKRQVYNRYYEFNLEKVSLGNLPKATQSTDPKTQGQTTPATQTEN